MRLNFVTLLCLAGIWSGCARTGLDRDHRHAADIGVTDAADDADAADGGGGDVALDVDAGLDADAAVGICGDGIVEGDEECDDGAANNDVLADACRTSCRQAWCGDGVIDALELCDDGNDDPADACDACGLPAVPCTPCESDEACGRSVDRCVELIDGSWCGQWCEEGTDTCPFGTVCTVLDRRGAQCVPELQVCVACYDRDGDGYGIGTECLGFDCDDDDPAINPGAEEICDDIDNDCDGLNDEGCPPDLLVNRETVMLHGERLYDRVRIWNGGVVQVTPFAGTPGELRTGDGTGCLRIEARIITVEAASSIDARAAGGGGPGLGGVAGFGSGLENSGPGGGGHGGRGGAGGRVSGGRPYGTIEGDDIDMGSNGGAFEILEGGLGEACDILVGRVSRGGLGGGCIELRAPSITIDGTLMATGGPGQSGRTGTTASPVDGGGGGSGGGILLVGDRVVVGAGALLEARGGAGGDGGNFDFGGGGENCVGNGAGGGGGGRIKVLAESRDVRGRLMVDSGTDGEGPQSDARGAVDGTSFVGP